MWQSAALRFATDHPTAAGHFPDFPVIPGAVILDDVIAAIEAATGQDAVGFRAVKFLLPVCPGETLALRWQHRGSLQVSFECTLPQRGLAVAGVIELGALPS
jgi:3-hydroxyacyl-[acyl-carrier-protein] dehydratase